jgi:biopolymer transport protein ExbD
MRKLTVVNTACLVIITAVLLHRAWSEYRQTQEAQATLNTEAAKPPRFKTELPFEDIRASDPSHQLVISVDDVGGLRLNAEEVGTINDMSRLRSKLEQLFKERGGRQPDRTVSVRASRKLPYGEIAKVIDAAKSAGADPVGLQVGDSKSTP